MNRKVKDSIALAQALGVLVVLGRPVAPPPDMGWAPHLAETVDITPPTLSVDLPKVVVVDITIT